ncbi:MAG TPA: metallophosphoesterase [Thermomicrobiaceae bacterium]|nr:metallophosphoesterase [Thermomicrobiaceae bacterium]
MGLLVYGWKVEPRTLRVRHFAINLPGVLPAYDGFRIAFMSDFHLFGPGKNNQVTDLAIDALLSEQPDLVLLGGDFYDHANWRPDRGAFARLAELKVPVYGVLGNHDMRRGETNSAAIARLIERSGATVLRNRTVEVCPGNHRVSLTGVDDPYSGHADLDRAMGADCPASGELSILLTHAPTIVDNLPVGRFSLVLAGHTHGGQVRTSPWNMISPLDLCFYLDRIFHQPMSRQQRGFRWERGSLIYVTTGVGTTRWPIRIGAPPEVVILRLRGQALDSDAACDSADRYVEEMG